MATYRSLVNAVIVSTDADDVISVRKVLKRQYDSPKIHGYARQIVYSSGGRPVTASSSNMLTYTMSQKRDLYTFAYNFGKY